ncbi:MAG: HNH endonuclease [Pseudobdellovibrionaceae bacterium]
MNLKKIESQLLMEQTDDLVTQERDILTNLLHQFREIERRRLFSFYKYKSLHDMLVKRYGFSGDEAYRRIVAMKMLKELPEIEEKINSGEISLTHINLAQSLFRQEEKLDNVMDREEKLSVIEKISNTTTREASKITLSMSSAPELMKPDTIKVASEHRIELRLNAPSELEDKIKKLKGILAHENPQLTTAELFDLLCDLGIKEWSQANKDRPFKKGSAVKIPLMKKFAAPINHCVTNSVGGAPEPLISKARLKRELFAKAGHQCENCGSGYALEIDHIRPLALGGTSEKENLRVLCKSCNQRAAIQNLGIEKMAPYLN